MAHEKKRLFIVTLFAEPFERFITDHVTGMPFVKFATIIVVLPGLALFFEQWIEVQPLSWKDFIIVEPDWFRVEVPLADNGRLIACLLKLNCHVGLVIAIPGVHEGHKAIFMTVLSSKNGSSARRADRIGAVNILKKHTFAGQSVDILGRAELLEVATVAANRLPGMIGGHNEEDVGFPTLSRQTQYQGE